VSGIRYTNGGGILKTERNLNSITKITGKNKTKMIFFLWCESFFPFYALADRGDWPPGLRYGIVPVVAMVFLSMGRL
jgi:hypothetical protein